MAKQEEVIYQLKMEAVEMLQKIDAQDVAAEVEVAVSETSEMPKQKKIKGLSAVLQHCLGTSSCCNHEEVSNEERVDREIKQYEDNPPVEVSVEALDWWSKEEKKFSVLSCLACKYLCICGTSVCLQKSFLVMVVTL